MNIQTEILKSFIEDLRQDLRETTKSLRKSNERFDKSLQESAKARQESAKARQEAARDRQESAKAQDDFRKSMKAMQKELGGISNSNGDVAESYFINSFSKSMSFAGQEYDTIDSHVKRKIKKLKLQAEYDLVMYNCSSIVVIEIKYKADKDDVADLLLKAPIFKQLFPQYANYDMYLGLAALNIGARTEKESLKQGIAVIKQVGDAMIINDAHLKVF